MFMITVIMYTKTIKYDTDSLHSHFAAWAYTVLYVFIMDLEYDNK